MSNPQLQLDAVTKTYEGNVTVLDGVSLSINSGESIAITGPSGCGKTTLLNIIGTLARPTSGSISFEGRALEGLDEVELAAFRNTSVGFVFQSHHLLPQCSAIANVLIPTLVHPDGSLRAEAPKRAESLLDSLGLADRMQHRPGALSGGQRQRVAVARALINNPRLVLADEPTGSLDEKSAEQLADILTGLHEAHGVTVITATHSPALAERMSRRLTLHHGRVAG